MTEQATQAQQRSETVIKPFGLLQYELRELDGWDFKQYVLGILFYRFISEILCDYLNEVELILILTTVALVMKRRNSDALQQ